MVTWIAAAAGAAQLGFDADRSLKTHDYAIAWSGGGEAREVRFTLPAAKVDADRLVPRKPDLLELAERQAVALRAWARKLKGVTLDVRIDGLIVRWSANGTDAGRVQEAMDDASDVAEAAKAEWREDQRVFVVAPNAMSYDHAAIAAEAADDVRALSTAVSRLTAPRAYAEEVLVFVQSIPFEAPGRGGDRGFRPPLAVLDRNLGDCDSKATLFLALMKARFPEVDSAMIYVPGHALVALELPVDKGDETVAIGGRKWVLAEPVGPRETPLGVAPDGHGGQARKGIVRIVSPR